MNENIVHFLERQCLLQLGRYDNGRLAIQLNTVDGEPVVTATINVPAMPLTETQVLIKDYGENQGVLVALEDAGVVRSTGVRCRIGHVEVNVCQLLISPPTVH